MLGIAEGKFSRYFLIPFSLLNLRRAQTVFRVNQLLHSRRRFSANIADHNDFRGRPSLHAEKDLGVAASHSPEAPK